MQSKPNFFTGLLRETADYRRFFRQTPDEKKEIVFYAEHQGYYPCFEGVIEKLLGRYPRNLCYVTSDPNDPLLREAPPRINTFYLNRLLPFFMAFVRCRVFILTMTDLNQFHLKRSVNPVHYVYIFHALVSTHMVYRYGAFDHYDSVLCTGPHHVKEIRRHEQLNKLAPKRLKETGYYRLERIYAAYQEYSRKRQPLRQKDIVLIAPSWGKANVLESCGKELVDILLKAGYQVIVRPHPETVRSRPDLIKLLASKFGANPDFTLELSITGDSSLLKADVLISDYSGIALEYAFGTERPVLFFDVPAKINNRCFNNLGIDPLEVSLRGEIGTVISMDELTSVLQAISGLREQAGAYREKIIKLRDSNIYNFGRSSDIGAEYINKIFSMDEHRCHNK